jgi:hypothetical protein
VHRAASGNGQVKLLFSTLLYFFGG